jgi:hypothetical protein
MKSLPLIFILIVTCIIGIAAQEAATPCPSIEVTGPAGITPAGDTVTFTADVKNYAATGEIKYNWSISAGEIEDGQGTSAIILRTTKEMNGSNVTATVEIDGLPEGCAKTASETAGVLTAGCGGGPVDRFGRAPKQMILPRVDNLLIILRGEPGSTAVIQIKLNERESRALRLEFLNNIYNRIFFLKFDLKRIIFEISKGPYETEAAFWQVLPGGYSPSLEDSVVIKGTEYKQKINDIFKPKINK